MKRSERITAAARHEMLMFFLFLSAGMAAGAWAARVAQSSGPGGLLLLAAALVVLRLGGWHGSEWRRLAKLARRERCFETEFCRVEVRL
jgi:hypothetical protein